jgi:hypothetical protein
MPHNIFSLEDREMLQNLAFQQLEEGAAEALLQHSELYTFSNFVQAALNEWLSGGQRQIQTTANVTFSHFPF